MSGERARTGGRPRIVIVGAGFGGLHAALALSGGPADVLVLDRRNFHLFQPLLYQVATAGLAPGEISRPVRAIFRAHRNLDFRLAEVTGIDLDARRVLTGDGPVEYDRLIFAAGGETNFFGLQGVARHGFGLKDVEDAVRLRNHVLHCFERAVADPDPRRRRALLCFLVAGGGPTGVEMAGALSELARLVLARDYPRLRPEEVRIAILEAGDRLLPVVPEDLSERARASLEAKGVEVRLGAGVEDCEAGRVRLAGGETIESETLIWAAGVRAVGLAGRIGAATGPQGRLLVGPDLSIPGHPEAFVIGDASGLLHEGRPLPMVAPVAVQQGRHAAENVLRSFRGEASLPFRYRDPGTLATIGRNAAVAWIGGWKFAGFAAWVVWLVVHLIQLIGFRNRLVVLINWAWDYFLYERAVRMITKE